MHACNYTVLDTRAPILALGQFPGTLVSPSPYLPAVKHVWLWGEALFFCPVHSPGTWNTETEVIQV